MIELTYDNWDKQRNNSETIVINQPSEFNIVARQIAALNQKEYTEITLSGTDSYLVVSGGSGDYICVFSTDDNEHSYTLVNSKLIDQSEQIRLVTGGQAAFFNAYMVSSLEKVVQAAFYYITHEDMDAQLEWLKYE